MQMQPRLLPRASLMYYIFLAWQEICVIFLGVELPIQELAVHHVHLTFLRRWATPESIDALPTWKFKLKKNRDVDDQKVNSGAPKLRPQPSCRLGVCLCYSSGLWWNHLLYQTVGSWLRFFTRLVASALFLWVALKLVSLNFVWLSPLGPSGLTTTVQSAGIHHESLVEGLPSDNVGFSVRNVAVKDLRRGFVASNSKDDPAKEAANLTARSLSRITMAKLEMVMSQSLAATPLTLR